MSISSVAIEFSIIDSLSKGVSVIKDRLHSLSSASKEVKQDFDRMAASFKYAAMTGLATREIYKGMKPAVGLAGDLQQEMLGVEAELMGAGTSARQLGEELKAIKSTAFGVQAATPFDMTQIVALEKELIKAGAKVEDITGKTGAAAASAALAVYEKLDPVETGKALIGIATPFKIAATGYMELADTISRAASASTVGAAEIAESAKYAAGPLASLGKSSREMLGLSAVMAQVGISGSMAGVALKEFFLEAAKNKAFKDVKGNLLPTVEIIEKLKKAFKGVGEADRAARLNKLFGERGMQAAIALLNEGKGSYKDIIKSMEQSATLQDKLNKSMQGFNNQMLSLRGTFKSTIADLFQPALPILTDIVAKTNELVTALGMASQKNGAIGKTTTVLSGGLLGLGAVATLALGTAGVLYGRRALKGVGGFKGLIGNIGADAAGIAKGKAVEAATGVAPVFITNWPDGMGGIGSAAKNTVETLAASVGGFKALLFSQSWRAAGSLGGAGLVGAAALGGYAVGTGISVALDNLAESITGEKAGLGGLLYDIFHGTGFAATPVQNNINIKIDKEGRAFHEGNAETRISIARGDFNAAAY